MRTKGISSASIPMLAIFGWLTAISAGAGNLTLIPMGSVWRYLDDGSNQDTAWYSPSFDDSGWASGPAQLGYGNGDEATVVNSGSGGGEKYITTYFRHAFVVPNAQACSNLTLRLLRDDGAVVYLNGQEVARVGMPPGPIDYLSLATECALEGKLFVGTMLDTGMLVNGTNVLAVEIHQVSPVSSDISFDLELADEPVEMTQIIDLPTAKAAVASPANLSLTAKAANLAGVTKLEFMVNETKVGERSMYNNLYATFPCTIDGPTNCTLSVAATDQFGIVRTASVDVVVEPTPGSATAATLIAAGSDWRYLDNGTDPGMEWRSPGFDDGSWSVGRGPLGYGWPGLSTTTRSSFITTYFRHTFEVSTPSRFFKLGLRVRRDQGVKVYLNGADVFRNNLPSDPVVAGTTALEAMETADFVSSAYFDASLLIPGRNVLAVETHGLSASPPAMAFDLELVGITTPRLSIRTAQPGGTVITWPHPSTGFRLMESPSLTPATWTPVTLSPVQMDEDNQVLVESAEGQHFYQLQSD